MRGLDKIDFDELYQEPENKLKINLPSTFIIKNKKVSFSWTELYWGWKSQFISDKTLIEIAETEVTNTIYSEPVLELASIMDSEIYTEQIKIQELIEQIIDSKLLIDRQYILNCKNKYLYAIVSYIDQYPTESKVIESYNKLTKDYTEDSIAPITGYEYVLDVILNDFHNPSKPAKEFYDELLMWTAYGITVKNEELLKLWRLFLENQRTCFINQWYKK